LDVQPSSTYQYRIRALNAVGYSAYSNTVEIVIPGLPLTAPENPAEFDTFDVDFNFIIVTWKDNSSSESGFEIERCGPDDPAVKMLINIAADNSVYTDTVVQPASTYYYRIRAFNSAGYSAWTDTLTVITPVEEYPIPTEAPYRPTRLSAGEINVKYVRLDWLDNSSNETGFEIESSGPNNLNTKNRIVVESDKTTFTDTLVLSNAIYIYRIRAFNEAGYSNIPIPLW